MIWLVPLGFAHYVGFVLVSNIEWFKGTTSFVFQVSDVTIVMVILDWMSSFP